MPTSPPTGGGNTKKENLLLKGLNHIFLPKKTPQKCEDDLEDIEDTLLTCLADHVGDVIENLSPSWTLKTWAQLQKLSRTDPMPAVFAQALSNTLRSCPLNHKVVLYIRQQNCTIIFTKLKEKTFRIDTFRSSLPPHEVMSSVGSLTLSYPHTTDYTENVDLLYSNCFAEQLCYLSNLPSEDVFPVTKKGGNVFAEVRDPPKPTLVSDFIVGMLAPEVTTSNQYQDAPSRIQKKIRDTVIWKSAYLPFRRSGLWISAKIVLHLCLMEEVKEEQNATLIYKVILLRMLADLSLLHSERQQHNWDLTHQMLAKLGKRIFKLDKIQPTAPLTQILDELKNDALQRTHFIIDKIHSKMQQQWATLSNTFDIPLSPIDRKFDEFQTDLKHTLPELDSYIISSRDPVSSQKRDGTQNIMSVVRCTTLSQLSDRMATLRLSNVSESSECNLDPVIVWLCDVEAFIHQLPEVPLVSTSSSALLAILKTYTDWARTAYVKSGSNPVAFSRMVLTLLCFVQKLDQIAVSKSSLLKQYKSGVQENVFEKLLLSLHSDRAKMANTYAYFKKRNFDANHDSIIQNSGISKFSFSVCYAETNPGMQSLRQKLLNETEERIQQKMAQVSNVKQECLNKQRQLSQLECKYYFNSFLQRMDHQTRDCSKCKLSSQLGTLKVSVTRFEKPLSIEPHLQQAVVFELLIPVEIFCLREALALVSREEILDWPVFNGVANVHGTWFPYLTEGKYTQGIEDKKGAVCFGSTYKPVSASHFGSKNQRKRNKLDVLLREKEDFIIENGMNCVLTYNSMLPTLPKRPQDPFSFQLQSTSESHKRAYSNLQEFVSGTSHTQNYVLSRTTDKCHPDLSIAEYVSFGSLRSGSRIQLRNMYKFLSDRSLKIEKEPVLALILQTLWQVGPVEDDIMSDFHDQEFCAEYLVLLESIVKSNANNWASPIALLAPVVIVTQILERNSDSQIRKSCRSLLETCRAVIDKWVEAIEDLLAASEKFLNEEKEIELLKQKLLEASICSAFTFSGLSHTNNGQHFILRNSKDITHWLKTQSRMNYLINIEKIHKHLSPFVASLLRFARQTIPLMLETRLYQVISQAGGHQGLNNFVASKWRKFSDCFNCSWKRCTSSKSHAYQGDAHLPAGIIHILHVDILTGEFLVDGYPPSYLPSEILQNPLFRSYFKAVNFKVQRDKSTFTSVRAVNGKVYSFFVSTEGKLICRESVDSEDTKMELLSPDIFQSHVAPSLVQNYTHWLDSIAQTVHFRRKSERDYSQDCDYTLTRNLHRDGWSLWEVSSEKCLLSIHSQGYAMIERRLGRFEERDNIYIMLDIDKKTITANLPRMGLNFLLKNGQLVSLEFPEFHVALNQNVGTLVGLQHSLTLENLTEAEVTGSRKIRLVPHGQLETMDKPQTDYHHKTIIHRTKNPTVYVLNFQTWIWN